MENNFKIPLIETNTKKGDRTIARRRYLKLQIAKLEMAREKQPDESFDSLFTAVCRISYDTTLAMLIRQYKDELMDLLDLFDQYNS